MRMSVAPRGGLLVVFLLLSACASAPKQQAVAPKVDSAAAQVQRETDLYRQNHWYLSGRVAIRAGNNAGSGRLLWQQRGEDFDITLSAPITRQGWQLSRNNGRVELTGLAGGPQSGVDAEALLFAATGWRLPVAAMAAWLRGLRANPDAVVTYAPSGLPATLQEQGWAVEYRDWGGQTPALPQRLFASRDDASVRVVIESWDAP